jgi:hypothetical protein
MHKKIIFVMPPKDWFYGIDYKHTYEMVRWLKRNKKIKIYIWKDIDIFLKKKISIENFFKIIKLWLYFKIRKIDYVFAYNASYILYCNLTYKKKIINFFSQLLKLKCVLRWDHINQQIPNIVENIYKKSQISQENDYRDFFFKHINHKNFLHFTWQKRPYVTNKNTIHNFFKKYNVKLDQLSFGFVSSMKKFNGKHNGKVIVAGHFVKKEFVKENLLFCRNLFKNEEKFYKKNYHNLMLQYSDYLIYTKKKKLISNYDGFYGFNQKKKFKVVYPSIFYENLSKYFVVINPYNPANQTITYKIYQIFLSGGFCLSEFQKDIPPKLYPFRNYIFYKNIKDLNRKISFLKKNEKFYVYLKKKIYKVALDLFKEDEIQFRKLFLR